MMDVLIVRFLNTGFTRKSREKLTEPRYWILVEFVMVIAILAGFL
jgi:hypothetical protein